MQGRWIFSLLYAVIYLAFLLGTFASRRLPYRIRALILVSSLFLIALAILIRVGMSGVGLQLMLGVCFMVAVLFGVRAGVLAILVSLACIGYVAFGMTTGFIDIYPEHMLTSRSPMAWITGLCVFFMMVSITVIAPEMLRRRIEESLVLLQGQKKGVETLNQQLEREIQGRRQAEEALKDSEALYRLVTESSLTGIYIIQDNRLVYANKRLCEMGGYRPEEILGRDFSGFIHSQDIGMVKGILGKRLQGLQAPNHYQVRVLKRDGSHLWVELFDAMGDYKGRSATIGNMVDISASKQAEAALRETDKTLFQIVQGNSIPTFVIDREHVVTYWNKACENLTGISASDIIGTRKHRAAFYCVERPVLADLIVDSAPEDDMAKYYPRGISESVLIEGAYEVEDFFPNLGKRGKWLFFTATPLKDSEGGVIGAIETLQDITDRKFAEQSLKQEQAFLRHVIDTVPGIICVKMEDGRFALANRALAYAYGTTVADLEGKKDTDFSPTPEEAAAFRKDDLHVIRGRVTKTIPEEEITFADGTIHWLSTTKIPLVLQDGTCSQLLAVAVDITERKQAEEALRNSEAKYRELVQNANSIILRMDTEGNITFFNEFAQSFFGYSEEEILGRNVVGTIVPQTDSAGQDLEAMVRDIGLRPERYETNENENMRQNGERVWVTWTNKGIRDADENVVGILCIGNDITQRKSIEDQLRQAQKMEAIGTLAGGIAHDFNNILGGIIGYTELAMMDESPDPDNRRYQYLSRLLEAGNRAKDLIQQILKFSKRDSAAMSAFSITPVVKESVKLLRAILPKSIDLQQRIQADPDRIMGDPTQVHQVIMNLCTNAYHVMRGEGGVLSITLENARIESPRESMSLKVPPGDYIRLSVSDTGSGIAPQILERIFEPYFTTKKISEGTGLGLSVTLGIVKSHNGLIELTSRVGEGTRFDVYFPVTQTRSVEAASRVGALPAGHMESVLVVDDELFFLDVLKENLQTLNYRVTANQSSVKTLEAFKSNPNGFDLVITDQSMPEMTGVQLVAEIRKYNRDIPIILCTGYSEIVSEKSAKHYGITKFLMKPIAATELAWAVHEALGVEKVGSHG
ncbi:MAG: PAS domain S-box protein [Deltaproteobacteria bacterium]|nr:PAS domain S-box protein [Deltaproteobacteria bacterium]